MDRIWLSSWAVSALLIGALAGGSAGCEGKADGKPKAEAAGPGAKIEQKAQPPVPVESVTLTPERIERRDEATGTLAAREEVVLVSELSRRLVAVSVEDGDVVKRGQVLFRLDNADLIAQQRVLDTRLKLARQTEARLKGLLATSAVSQQEYDRAASEVAVMEAERQALGVTLSRTLIRAPFDGRAGFRQVSKGAWVGPTTPLITITDTQRLLLDLSMPEETAPLLKPGMPLTFRVAGRAAEYKATLSVIDPRVDAATRSLRVRAAVEPGQDGLSPGALVQVNVGLDATPEGLMVPAMAVVPTPRGHAVFVLDKGDVAREVDIEIGMRTPERVQVLRGLEPGQVVLTSNLLRLRTGAKVKLVGAAQ